MTQPFFHLLLASPVVLKHIRQMHEREELYSMWGPDIPHVAPATALSHFAIAFSGFVAFGFLCNYVLTPDRPAVPRQYPFNGLVRELGGIEDNKVIFSHMLPLLILSNPFPS